MFNSSRIKLLAVLLFENFSRKPMEPLSKPQKSVGTEVWALKVAKFCPTSPIDSIHRAAVMRRWSGQLIACQFNCTSNHDLLPIGQGANVEGALSNYSTSGVLHSIKRNWRRSSVRKWTVVVHHCVESYWSLDTRFLFARFLWNLVRGGTFRHEVNQFGPLRDKEHFNSRLWIRPWIKFLKTTFEHFTAPRSTAL